MNKKAVKVVAEHWNIDAAAYQKRHKISTDYVHYGPSCPVEKDLNLLGPVKGKKIIELGCGGGQNSIALAKRGAICTGVDISDEQIKFAEKLTKKNKVKVKFIRGDIQNLNMIKSKSYDIAISMFAFDWVQSLDKTFEEAHRVLKDKGLFVFSMGHPFFNCLGEEIEELKLKISYFQKKELFKERTGKIINYILPTVGDILNTLIKTGFVVEKILEPTPVKEKFGAYRDYYPLKILKMVPSTIIIKAIKTSK